MESDTEFQSRKQKWSTSLDTHRTHLSLGTATDNVYTVAMGLTSLIGKVLIIQESRLHYTIHITHI